MIDEYDVLHTLSTKKPHCSGVTNGGEVPRAQGGEGRKTASPKICYDSQTQQVEYDNIEFDE